jgi:hypothetical protein
VRQKNKGVFMQQVITVGNRKADPLEDLGASVELYMAEFSCQRG